MTKALLFSAGDVSGDEHAAELVLSLRSRFPGIRCVGLGGEAMRRAGVEIVVDQRELAIGGLLGVGRSLLRIASVFRKLREVVKRELIAGVVLVDSGGFNLPFAAWLRRRTPAPILYYVAPQAWAWRPGRARKLARRADRILVIFPFEVDFYKERGIAVDFVGHPLVDRLCPVAESLSREGACDALGLDPSRRWVGLLPGSRRNEVTYHLPLQLDAAQRLASRDENADRLGFAIGVAPSLSLARVQADVDRIFAKTSGGWPAQVPLELISGFRKESGHPVESGRPAEIIRASSALLLKPGTSVIEALLLDRPMVVMGQADSISAGFAKQALGMRYLAMPNLLGGAAVVPEFLQENADPARMAEALAALLDGSAALRQLEAFRSLRPLLGQGGAVARASELAGDLFGLVEA